MTDANGLTHKSKNATPGCFQNCSGKISSKIGDFFYGIGVFVASHPWKTIIFCLFIIGIFCTGFLRFRNEKNPLNLWVPRNSQFLKDTDWLMTNFEEGHRPQTIIVTASNVLEPKNLKRLAIINKAVKTFIATLNNGTEISWNDVCFKIPIIADYVERDSLSRKKRNIFDFGKGIVNLFSDPSNSNSTSTTSTTSTTKKPTKPFNPSVDLSPRIFCKFVEKIPFGCLQSTLIEAWNYDANIIGNLTLPEVLNVVNKTKISPATGHEVDFISLLGDIERNEDGYILSAKSLISDWFLYINFSHIDHEKIGNTAGTEDFASEIILSWEEKFIETIKKLQKDLEDDDFKIYLNAGRSFADISSESMFQDFGKLFFGGFLMFVFMQIVLSKFSVVELRVGIASFGLLIIGLAFGASCGFCSVIGVPYGPVHTSLPFLLMGLGVDDIFVMMACWRKVKEDPNNQDQPINIKMGLMLKHAGVSITVTSVTDMVAFLVGATTILPSLQSFCVYAAFGICFTYLLAVTFFVACFTLDEKRIQARRNALLPCIVHSESVAKPCCDKRLMEKSITFLYSKIILTTPGKIAVILIVLLYTGFGIESMLKLEQKFDPMWFIPKSTYLGKYIDVNREYYPNLGYDAGVYMGKLNYTEDILNIIEMSEELRNHTDILFKVKSWVEPFNKFIQTYYDKDLAWGNITDTEFRTYLSKFLFTQDGGKYQKNFRFAKKLKCGKMTPAINVSSLEFTFKKFEVRSEYIPSVRTVKKIVRESNLNSGDGYSLVWGKIFGNWVTDEIIDEELIRNICLALICVMACTAILIVNLQICFWVLICVLLTLVNVGGYMQRWGLTVDLVSCIGLQLAVGLCVDYAAHIGHTFLTISRGTKTQRALDTVLHIGSAVFYGGSSTILALIMLCGSEAYTFNAFFKIFLLVILFGQFHGVVFLPVMLSIVGPKPYHKIINEDVGDDKEMLNLQEQKTITITAQPMFLSNNDDLKYIDEAQPLNL